MNKFFEEFDEVLEKLDDLCKEAHELVEKYVEKGEQTNGK